MQFKAKIKSMALHLGVTKFYVRTTIRTYSKIKIKI